MNKQRPGTIREQIGSQSRYRGLVATGALMRSGMGDLPWKKWRPTGSLKTALAKLGSVGSCCQNSTGISFDFPT